MKPIIRASIDRYVADHIETGGFLRAVLENDLKEAFARADEDCIRDMFEIVGYCYNEIPALCWGSPEKVAAWLAQRNEAAREAGL